MNIALMAHDRKKELMVQFCIAYCGILAEHSLCATHVTGKLVSEATGLPITLYLHADQGGSQQIGARISFNEIDLVLFFCDPANPGGFDDINKIERLCDACGFAFYYHAERNFSYGKSYAAHALRLYGASAPAAASV